MPTSTLLDSLRNQPPIRWLRERDIDLLICSELHFDGGPLQKLFAGGWNNGVSQFDGAWVSHWDAGDETDIVASFKSDSGSLALLIEDKIDAEFQPDQPERYRQRAQRWKEHGPPGCDVETVLLAPSGYFENEGSEIFDRQVSYEEVIDALAQSSDPRTLFLAEILKNGIESHRQGYKPEHDEVTTQVWSAFWEIANAETPYLRMRKPGSKPSGAGFIEFSDAEGVSPAETMRRAKIIYKRRHCNVDLQFANLGEATLRSVVAGLLAPDMAVVQAGKSASIRIEVPAVDFTKTPNGQEESIKEGLQAAERLRLLFIEKGLRNYLKTN